MQPATVCYSEINLLILAVSSVASVDVLACNRMSDAFDGNLMLTAQILAHYLCCKKNGLPIQSSLNSLNSSEKIIEKWWFPKYCKRKSFAQFFLESNWKNGDFCWKLAENPGFVVFMLFLQKSNVFWRALAGITGLLVFPGTEPEICNGGSECGAPSTRRFCIIIFLQN